MNASVSYAGIITMIITGGTYYFKPSQRQTDRKIGTGMLTTISVSMTAKFWKLQLKTEKGLKLIHHAFVMV